MSAGVVRGISDLLSGKTDADLSGTQELAADAASAAAFEILHGLVPPPKSSPKSKKRRVKLPKRKADRSKKAREMPLVETPPTEELPTFPEVPNNIQQGGLLQEGRVSARIGVPDLDEVLFSFFIPPDVYLQKSFLPRPLDAPLKNADVEDTAVRYPVPMLKKRGQPSLRLQL